MNKINIKGFTILELLISFIILTSIIYSFAVIVSKTSLFQGYKQNYVYSTTQINDIKEKIINQINNCTNKEIIFTGTTISLKDTFINNENIFYDKLVLLCDDKEIIFSIYDKNTSEIINPLLKNNNGGFFSIYDNSISEQIYLNKNINILLFTFNLIELNGKKNIRLNLNYDNNLSLIQVDNNINTNYLSGSTFFLFNID